MSGIIIGAILTFLTGWVLWLIQKEKFSVVYDLVESDTFPREHGIGRFFVLKLRNAGNKPVQKLEIKIILEVGRIESIRLTDSSLVENTVTSSSEWHGVLVLLNPKESFEITVTAEGSSVITTPKISARTFGVTASPQETDGVSITIFFIFCLIGVIGGFSISHFLFHQNKTDQSMSQINTLGTNLNQKVDAVEQKLNEQTPLMYEFLMAQDEKYDLKSLQKELIQEEQQQNLAPTN